MLSLLQLVNRQTAKQLRIKIGGLLRHDPAGKSHLGDLLHGCRLQQKSKLRLSALNLGISRIQSTHVFDVLLVPHRFFSDTERTAQQWARGIFEDQPAGPDVCGVRCRTAYNFGYSLALWDCDDSVEIVHDSAGRVQDLALDNPRVLGRLQVEMRKRRIDVTTIPESECSTCQRA